jgi:hypothetical protein
MFTWTDSSNSTGSNVYYYFYLFQVTGKCPSGDCLIWVIPSFTSSIQSIIWGIDPTNSSNTPSVSSLTSGDMYEWLITVVDSSGNQASTSTLYMP